MKWHYKKLDFSLKNSNIVKLVVLSEKIQTHQENMQEVPPLVDVRFTDINLKVDSLFRYK